jgi:hypothetical protein
VNFFEAHDLLTSREYGLAADVADKALRDADKLGSWTNQSDTVFITRTARNTFEISHDGRSN